MVGKKKIAVKWKKISGIDGYEVQVASNKKFTKDLKVIKIKKATITSKTVKKLKAKTKKVITK